MSDGCKIKKSGDTYSVGYNLSQNTAKIYCEGGSTATVPYPPNNLVAEPSNASVTLTWDAPLDGGSDITDYKIEYATSPASFTVFVDGISTSTSATVTGLTNGIPYLFRVSAINSVGTSVTSQLVYAIPFTTPSAPSITGLARLAGSGTAITITWSAPVSNGGSAITQYIIQYSGNGGSSWQTTIYSGNDLSNIIGGLTTGTSYIFRIAAVNIAGAGSFSSNSSAIIPATTPSSPINLSGVLGDSQVSLTWSAPSSNGGLAITDYTIQYSSDGGENWNTFSDGVSTNTNTIITGLTNGISYIFRVLATNSIGNGLYSEISSEKVPGTIPNAPTIRFITAQDSAIQLSWDEPTDNGGYPVNYYTIRYSSNSGSTWTNYPDPIYHTASITNTTITGLTNGLTYIVQVKAANDIGSGPYSTSSDPVTPVGNASCIDGNISHDYVLVFIDETHPLYVKGSGQVGALWGADLEYYNSILSDFPTCATILFDVDTPFVARGVYKGQSISSDPFYIFPTGVNSSQYEQCVLPIDNITGIARPSGGVEYNGSINAIGSISANTFATGIVNAIETFWGSNFWNRMENSYNPIQERSCKLWITRGHTISLGSGILSSGIEIFSNYVINNKNWTTNNIGIYINTCGERYLGWIPDVIQSQGNNDSCFNTTRVPDITQDNECGSNAGDRLVKFYFDAPDYPGYTYLNTCSGTDNLNDQFDGNIFFEGLSLRIHPLFSCTGVYNSSMVTTFNDPSNNRLLAQWNFYSSTFGMDQNPASRSVYPWVYEGKMYLSYENNVPYVTVGVAEWDDRVVEPSNSAPGTFYIWKSPVPLDVYGVPSGTVEESFVVASGRLNNLNWVVNSVEESNFLANLGFSTTVGSAIEAGTGIPQFPNISFVSSPSCSTTPLPGSICLSIP